MEVLSDILRGMHVHGSVYFCDKLEAPWTLKFDEADRASFHMVRRGHCWVKTADGYEQLGPGDLVYLEAGVKHTLTSSPPSSATPGGACTLLLCGYCDFDDGTSSPLLDVFPSVTIVRDEEIRQHAWLKATLDQLSNEFTARQPGAELVIDKLTEIVIVELIRINFGRAGDSAFVQALSDKQISAALHLLHEKPEQHWTLQSLAEEIGMSRAAFARRFRELVGLPMFEYLTNIRIERARELLSAGNLPITEVAYRVGYESSVAFTKTFRKQTGLTPAKYRKARRESSLQEDSARAP